MVRKSDIKLPVLLICGVFLFCFVVLFSSTLLLQASSNPVQLVVAMEARAIMMAKGYTMRKWEFPYKPEEIRSQKGGASTCFFLTLSYLTVSRLRE